MKKTIIRTATDSVLHRAALEEGAEILRKGGLVAFATETVYGIGANALSPRAVEGIFAAKGRPQDNPLIVHITSLEELEPVVRSFPAAAEKLARRFWPGPLTLVLPRSSEIPREVSAGLPTVAVRMPAHPIARSLIRLAGVPVAAPSANLSGRPSPTRAQHCIQDLDGRVDMILDSGNCRYGVESTVVSLAEPVPRLLRPGAVTPEQLREELGELEVDGSVFHAVEEGAAVSSPGMKYKHYAPKARIWLVHGGFSAYRELLERKKGPGVYALIFDGEEGKVPVPGVTYGREDAPASQAERLFDALRELDARGAEEVYARAPSSEGIGLAVYNRLVRASGFREIDLDENEKG